jgi:hypothetical protein
VNKRVDNGWGWVEEMVGEQSPRCTGHFFFRTLSCFPNALVAVHNAGSGDIRSFSQFRVSKRYRLSFISVYATGISLQWLYYEWCWMYLEISFRVFSDGL